MDDWREIRAHRDPHFFFGVGFGSDINGLHSQPRAAVERRVEPGQVPVPARSTSSSIIDKQRSGTRVYDINTDGVDHYGLYPDWIEDMRRVGGRADRGGHGQRRRGLPAAVGARGGGRAVNRWLPSWALRSAPESAASAGTPANMSATRRPRARSYHCEACGASLRYRHQASAIAASYGRPGVAARPVARRGLLRARSRSTSRASSARSAASCGTRPGYVNSYYWPDVAPGRRARGRAL